MDMGNNVLIVVFTKLCNVTTNWPGVTTRHIDNLLYSNLVDDRKMEIKVVDIASQAIEFEYETREVKEDIIWYVNDSVVTNTPSYSMKRYGYSHRLAIIDPGIISSSFKIKASTGDFDASTSELILDKVGHMIFDVISESRARRTIPRTKEKWSRSMNHQRNYVYYVIEGIITFFFNLLEDTIGSVVELGHADDMSLRKSQDFIYWSIY